MNIYALTNTNGRAVNNQFIRDDGKKKVFESYRTDIASVTKKNGETIVILTESWLYSATTTKYCCRFLSQEADFGNVNKAKVVKLIKDGKISVTEKKNL